MTDDERRLRLGRLVRTRREALGLSQADLARRAGLSQEAVSQIETGRTRAHLSSIDRLRSALGDDDEALLDAVGLSEAEKRAAAARGALLGFVRVGPRDRALLWEFQHLDQAAQEFVLDQVTAFRAWIERGAKERA